MKIIGLTGGIASGKSTVKKMLQKRNYEVIDADEVALGLQAIGSPILAEIVNAFGTTVLHDDGNLNRGELGKIIFGNVQARAKLNEIMHPAIRSHFEKIIEKSTAEVLFLDVPLLFEAGFDNMTNINLVISASQDVQLARLMLRNSLTQAEAQARINSQMTMAEKVAQADFVINNNGEIHELEKKVTEFLEKILNKVI